MSVFQKNISKCICCKIAREANTFKENVIFDRELTLQVIYIYIYITCNVNSLSKITFSLNVFASRAILQHIHLEIFFWNTDKNSKERFHFTFPTYPWSSHENKNQLFATYMGCMWCYSWSDYKVTIRMCNYQKYFFLSIVLKAPNTES